MKIICAVENKKLFFKKNTLRRKTILIFVRDLKHIFFLKKLQRAVEKSAPQVDRPRLSSSPPTVVDGTPAGDRDREEKNRKRKNPPTTTPIPKKRAGNNTTETTPATTTSSTTLNSYIPITSTTSDSSSRFVAKKQRDEILPKHLLKKIGTFNFLTKKGSFIFLGTLHFCAKILKLCFLSPTVPSSQLQFFLL